jgi:hypothetical protein
MKQYRACMLFLLSPLLCFPAMAQSKGPLLEQAIEQNRQLSKRIDRLARNLDELLSNRQSPVRNATQVQLIGNTRWTEQQAPTLQPQFALNLSLPAVEKRLRLQLASFDREDQFEGLERNRNGAQPQNQKTGASLGVLRQLGATQVLFRPRIEFRDPLVTSILIRTDQRLQFSTVPLILLTQKVFAHSVDGAGASAEVDFDFQLSDSVLLRFFNEAQYLDQDNFFETSQGPTLAWQISERMAWSSTLSFNGQNRALFSNNTQWNSFHLNSYTLFTSFSHMILRNVLHYQITPELRFPKSNRWKGVAGLNFQLSLIF